MKYDHFHSIYVQTPYLAKQYLINCHLTSIWHPNKCPKRPSMYLMSRLWYPKTHSRRRTHHWNNRVWIMIPVRHQ